MMGESAINPCETWIKQNPAISFAGLCLVKWCSGRDLNSHDLWSLPPQDSVSTNSTTRALIFYANPILLWDVAIFIFFRWSCLLLLNLLCSL